MKCIIFDKELTDVELISRQQYIYDVFKLYMLPCSRTREFIVLESLPKGSLDTIFLIGHNDKINDYLQKNKDSITEQYIIIISCCIDKIYSIAFFEGKTIYVSNNYNKKAYCYDDYNLGFAATDSEIILYRKRKKDFTTKLSDSFIKLGGD